jgi:uncharacterized protein (TIGR01777 family)
VRVAVTGATGLIGSRVVAALRERGDEVTVLTRDPARAGEGVAWRDPAGERAPIEALAGRDGVIHLAGESVGQRWSEDAKRRIRDSRIRGTRNLVDALRVAEPRPRVLVSQSAVGFYGPRGDEPVDESEPPGDDFLAQVALGWEEEAQRAEELGVHVARTRTGIVLARDGGALKRMLPPFKLGLGGPVGSGRQYMPWIHMDDVVGALLFCLDTEAASGPLNVTAPEPVPNREFAKTLGRVLRRPAVLPTPAVALKLALGEMSLVVVTGQRAVPKRLGELGYTFKRPDLEAALRDATS